MNVEKLIYDWNRLHPQSLRPAGNVLLNDETLRDGLQSPSVKDPSVEEKIEILHLMEALGIHSLNLGLPGAGPRAVEHVIATFHIRTKVISRLLLVKQGTWRALRCAELALGRGGGGACSYTVVVSG